MSKHLADHARPTNGGRVKHFLRIARQGSESAWKGLWQHRTAPDDSNRRVVEYVRIERGRQA